MASLADMIRQNKMQSIPQDKLLGYMLKKCEMF